ncbi:MAG: cupin domain-containing protein [Deltaproteobacteria bacterium]|nr:cupin domain-containing protein [Deltaproteobacteria bacterium]
MQRFPVRALVLILAGCAPRSRPAATASARAEAPLDASVAPDGAPRDAAPAPPAGPRPIAGTLPTLAPDAPSVPPSGVCERGTCRVTGLGPGYPSRPEEGATALPPAWAWLQRIAPGATLVLPSSAAVDLVGVVLRGPTEATTGSRTAPVVLAPWVAFRRTGGPLTLRASGSEPTVLLLCLARDAPGATPVTRASAQSFETSSMDALADLSWAGGAFHARIAFGAPDARRASLELLIGSEDAPVAEHDHPASWELLTALAAAGTLVLPASITVDGGVAPREVPVSDGQVVRVPPGVRHRWAPAGSRPLVAVQVYAPAGPEERFRTLAGAVR